MKISVNILGTSKNIDRLRVLTACAIRSKQHEVTMNFMAEGEKPSFLPQDWNWIPSEKYRLSDRHVHALIDGVANESYDYNIFCDDDVIIDVDKFVDQANQEPGGPCVWTTWPGNWCDPHLATIIKKHASKYVQGRQLSSMWMGFCTSVINRELCNIARKDHALLDSLLAISKELSANSFIPDLQISILGFLANAKHINGNLNNGTCWPDFVNSSLLISSGIRWHIHATGESPTVPSDALIHALKNAPFGDAKDLLKTIHPTISSGVKAKNYLDMPFHLAWFWRPWRSRIDYPDQNDIAINNCVMHANGKFQSKGGPNLGPNFDGTWEPDTGGWKINAASHSSTIDFFGLYDNRFPVGIKQQNSKKTESSVFMLVPIL